MGSDWRTPKALVWLCGLVVLVAALWVGDMLGLAPWEKAAITAPIVFVLVLAVCRFERGQGSQRSLADIDAPVHED